MDEKTILTRLLTSLPAGTFEMETFARLAGVVTTKRVPTAAMECKHRPRLLMNPDFLTEHCVRDEHLFLLVMHELWHVLLAHTSLYPRVTMAQNVAFDAIINANLMRQFKQPIYMGFFDKLYKADVFPELLLRPPMGWPDNPQYVDGGGPAGTLRVMRQLYPAPTVRFTLPFYDEVLDLLKQYLRDNNMDMMMPILLGDHQSNPDDVYRSHFLKETMGKVTKRWPYAPGRGLPTFGGVMNDWQVAPEDTTRQMRQAFSGLLRHFVNPHGGEQQNRQKRPIPTVSNLGVLPNGHDRMKPAQRMLGVDSLLWAQNGTINARVNTRQAKAFIYLDVSGSMSDVLPYLLHLITPYVVNGHAEVYQFSTQVDALPPKYLKKSVLKTTGGTNIHCVLNHLENMAHRVNRVMVLTDGYTGKPLANHVTFVKERKLPIMVVLPSESVYKDDLQDIATRFEVLPSVHD
jgi:hypothetical protein